MMHVGMHLGDAFVVEDTIFTCAVAVVVAVSTHATEFLCGSGGAVYHVRVMCIENHSVMEFVNRMFRRKSLQGCHI
eukprot:20056-Prymnesium_polylepis.1